jgi:hypothetical protein
MYDIYLQSEVRARGGRVVEMIEIAGWNMVQGRRVQVAFQTVSLFHMSIQTRAAR